MLKRTGFKKKNYVWNRKQGLIRSPFYTLKKSSKRMKSYQEVKGERRDVLQVREADSKFSKEIRKRDGQCVNCGSTLFLGCSHYFGRSIFSTRYDSQNCITLCQECHEKWELQKDGVYKNYMVMWLGEEIFLQLETKSKLKVSRYDSIIKYMKLSPEIEQKEILY